MWGWFMENMATIIVSAILVVVVTVIIVSMIRNKKKGRSSCGCGCADCPMGASCHEEDK